MSAAVLEPPVTATSEFTLEVYSKPSCAQCNATYRALNKKGLVYTTPMMDADELREFGTSLGLAQAPVVVVRADDGSIAAFWGGFNPTRIDEWAGRLPMTPDAAAQAA